MPPIDLRSDTVTQPTPEMRKAMAEAVVGDDVLGDDPTVRALERRTAELLGKPAAVYMPSGTMTNQVAIRTHTEPGDEIIMDATSHSYIYECGAPAALSGVTCKLIPGTRGIFTGDDVRAELRTENVHFPMTKLVCVENTHNRGGGSIWPMDTLKSVEAVAREAGLRLHMDGARLWNASVASGIPLADYARCVDSVSVCFSKGLGAPVGSALAGEVDFIARARRFRKMFGGGMRQVGIIAAGALYAVENQRERLAEDHANARALAEGIAPLPGIELNLDEVETNILYFDTADSAAEVAQKLAMRGVMMLALGPHRVRAVLNLHVTREDVETALKVFKEVCA
jgi:threonine aldolase